MAITGNLRTMQLSELLQWLSMGRKTGTLVVRGSPGEKRIYFDNGRIVSSSSTVEREYLGHFLVAHGYITEEELTRAMEVQVESKILLGKILVMIGAISEEDLSAILKLKAAETIYDIFLWTEGAFEFVDGSVPQLPMVPMSVDVTGIVLEGLRRYDEWARIKTRIWSLREIPVVTAPINLQSLTERDRLVLRTIDGARSIEQIAETTHNADFFVASFVFHLVDQGKAEIVGRAAGPDFVELTPEDPASMVFEEAGETPDPTQLEPEPGFDIPPPPPLAPAPAPVAAEAAPSVDFAQFLRRGPDSTAPARKLANAEAADPFSVRAGTPVSAGPEPRAAPPAEGPELPAGAPIRQTAVPVLNRPMEELISYSFTPNEAFILSRVNGLWDVRSIAKISPFPETEVLRVFQKLEAGGVISWR